MPFVFHRAEINAPAGVLWELLLDKIEHPGRYLVGISDVEVHRLGERTVERTMRLGGKPVREIISFDEPTLTVLFKLVDDAVFTGFVTNTIFTDHGTVLLDFTMNWTPRADRTALSGPDFAQTIRDAVLHLKELAEGGGASLEPK